MPDALLLCAAFAADYAGFAALALAMDVHWRQVRGAQPLARRTVIVLRTLGVLGLASSLGLCLHIDYASMASLVWIMTLVAAVLAVAFTLAWRPRILAPLIAWAPGA